MQQIVGDMAKFAIVYWEDHFVSLINLETVKEPRKPVLEYREGEFILHMPHMGKNRTRRGFQKSVVSTCIHKKNLLWKCEY